MKKKVALNKSSLKSQQADLKLYKQYLPSLDLKRQQFLAELRKARDEKAATERRIKELYEESSSWLSLLGSGEVSLEGLVEVKEVALDEENILGVHVPLLREVKIDRQEYSLITKPPWVDAAVELAEKLIRLRLQLEVDSQRLVRIQEALRTITQRVNLFDQVLIPEARETIRTINIYLADAQRAGVIRAKLAKEKTKARRQF